MSSPVSSDYDINSETDVSEICEIDSNECEVEDEVNDDGRESSSSLEDETQACADDPVADEQWTVNYEKELKEDEERNQRQQERLSGLVELFEWCKCGKCDVTYLQNISECFCCTELDRCVEALTSNIVRQDIPDNAKLVCITDHPGFQPVCLQKWSLRSAAWKYKTKGKMRYKQEGDEESFLRSVSYREFTRLVYGVIGNTRIPLPACAYAAIRRQFPIDAECTYVGFDPDEDV